jgi:hypothetical protein
MEVQTNNVPRDVIDAYELSTEERADFDYIDWDAIDRGEDSASFFRYRGQLFDLGEFLLTTSGELREMGWEGIATDTFFSATVVRYVDDGERVVVGRVYG